MPCGHIFCEQCLLKCTSCSNAQKLQEQSEEAYRGEQNQVSEAQFQLKCPTCQKVHLTHPQRLPCVYSILSHLPQNGISQLMEKQVTAGDQFFRQQSQYQQPQLQKSTSQNMISSGPNNLPSQPQPASQNYMTNNNHYNKQIKATACIRHPDKKIKFFCESDAAFLCSKCVIQHTGVGHVIQEFDLSFDKIKKDFTDVHQKYMAIVTEAHKSKQMFEGFEKRLGDLCNRQISKLELTYKSIAKILEQKKKEMGCAIKEFYSDSRQKIEIDRQKSSKFLHRVSRLQSEFDMIEKNLEQTSYEEFFKQMSMKSQELSEISEYSVNLMKNASSVEKNMMLAVFVDQVKIADYGNIQYVKASEYKSKGLAPTNHQQQTRKQDCQTKSPLKGGKREGSQSHSKRRVSNINQTANQEGGLLTGRGEMTQMATQEDSKRHDRSKQWALDEKVSKKLNNIISKIHEHPSQQPVSTKNNSTKEILDFKPEKDLEQTDLLSSSIGHGQNKNLSSTLNGKQQQEDRQTYRGQSNHTPHMNPHVHLIHQQRSDNDVILGTAAGEGGLFRDYSNKTKHMMLNDYEKAAQQTSNNGNTTRRVTMVPQLRTDQTKNQQHKTHLVEKDDLSMMGTHQGVPQGYQQNNVTQMYQGAGGCFTHRGENRYDRYANHVDPDYEFGCGGTSEKDNSKKTAVLNQEIQAYSKYLNPKPQQATAILTQSIESIRESQPVNPFENGLLKNQTKIGDDTKNENEILKELDMLDLKKKGADLDSQQRQLSSDDETLTRMLQDIQSKSQERKRPNAYQHNTNYQVLKNRVENYQKYTQENTDVNPGCQDIDQQPKLSKYTSNHCIQGDSSKVNGPQLIKKPKKDHSSKHHRSKKVHNDRYDNKSQQPSHKRNGSMQQDDAVKGLQTQRQQQQQQQQQQECESQHQTATPYQQASTYNKYL